jgi:hypothetical protein
MKTPACAQLRFSPDGRYSLAQDVSEITVLAVTPLAKLFRISAENAGDAQFTPDSLEIVFTGANGQFAAFPCPYQPP